MHEEILWPGKTSRVKGMEYPHLFQPGKIGPCTLKNRIIMPLYPTKYSTDSRVNDRMIAFYRERARGGAALIVLDCPCLDYPSAYKGKNELRMDEPSFREGLRGLLKAVQEHDVRAFMHLNYPKEEILSERVEGAAPKGDKWVRPRANHMTKDQALKIIDIMARGAERAREIGYDGIDIQAGYGDLIAQLLSPLSNHRTDDFGGALENRARFLTEVIRRVKEAAGKDFPVMVKLVCDEFVPGGLTAKETARIARLCEASGADAIVANAGNKKTKDRTIPIHTSPAGPLADLAREIKEAVTIPVAAIAKINTPGLADGIIAQGKADFVAMARALVADPSLPRKARDGRPDEIRPCIYCLEDCAQKGVPGLGRGCTVNPFAGQEAVLAVSPAAVRKNVVIVGGGPAGMQAAILCARRGHLVTLFEKEETLGGQFRYADRAPFKEENAALLRYLNVMIRKHGISVRLETVAGIQEIRAESPDAVILATGSRPRIPKIPKVDMPFVYDYRRFYQKSPYVGKRVAIIGGGDIGCETADMIGGGDREVTVVEVQEKVLPAMKDLPREALLSRLKEKNVTLLTGAEAVGVECGLLCIRDRKQKLSSVKADTIIVAAGAVPENSLLEPGKQVFPEIYAVGEAERTGNAGDALRSAARISLKI